MPNNNFSVQTHGRLIVQAVQDRAENDPRLAEVIDVLLERADRWVASGTVRQASELAEWWHVAWERLGDVAFAHALRPDETRARWLKLETQRLVDLPVDEWVGPFFRTRAIPPIGALETAHVALGIAEVLELCPDLFAVDERQVVIAALVERGLLPCERAVQAFERGAGRYRATGGREGTALNNWYMVLLDGFAAVALLIGDQDRIATLPERYRTAAALYNSDSYGESVQYWGYATLHLTNIRELVNAYYPAMLADEPAPYGSMMPWVAASVMFQSERPELGAGVYTTMVNFGDSAVSARPPADALTSIASDDSGVSAADRGLARWLFDRTYADVALEPSNLSSFGFFSQVGWRTAVNLVSAAAPASPDDLGLPTAQSFETGSVVLRDKWNETLTVLAAQTGNDRLNVDSHRHDDHGSFVLSHRDELFFADPGHCSYRLEAQRVAKSAASHSTWLLRDGGTGEALERSHAHGSPVGIRTAPWARDGWTAFSVDLAGDYGPKVLSATRTWISLLPHIVLIVDDIQAVSPIEVESSFVVNDRDHGLRVNEASPTRLVLRRGSSAAKFFRLSAAGDEQPVQSGVQRRWTALHDIYQPQVNAPTQGREGSGVVYSYSSPAATRHRAVYSIVMDREADIRQWHIYIDDNGVVAIDQPDGTRLTVDAETFAGLSA